MTVGTVVVVVVLWQMLAAWRDWPSPLSVLRRIASVRRHDVDVHPGGGRAAVTTRLPGPPAIEGRLTRPDFGACPGCGAASDRWCRADCRMIDPKDYR